MYIPCSSRIHTLLLHWNVTLNLTIISMKIRMEETSSISVCVNYSCSTVNALDIVYSIHGIRTYDDMKILIDVRKWWSRASECLCLFDQQKHQPKCAHTHTHGHTGDHKIYKAKTVGKWKRRIIKSYRYICVFCIFGKDTYRVCVPKMRSRLGYT